MKIWKFSVWVKGEKGECEITQMFDHETVTGINGDQIRKQIFEQIIEIYKQM